MIRNRNILCAVKRVSFIVILMVTWSMLPLRSYAQANSDLPAPTIKFITTASNCKLETVDWGGSGKALMFIAGLGATSHIFQNFAPLFTKKFHVYGMTRRGFGASSQPASGYDVETLAKDILDVADSLNLKKLILIGHSFAGAELTEFATAYPDRLDKIIYLDAAYDWVRMMSIFSEYPSFPPKREDYASLRQNQKYLARITGVIFPEKEMRASYIFDHNGKYVGNVSPDSVSVNILKALKAPDYAGIKVPILSIYIDDKSVDELFPAYRFTKANKVKAAKYAEHRAALADEGIRELIKQQPKANIKLIKNANHYVFISNPEETFGLISDFLSN